MIAFLVGVGVGVWLTLMALLWLFSPVLKAFGKK